MDQSEQKRGNDVVSRAIVMRQKHNVRCSLVREPAAGDLHVRFAEWRLETERTTRTEAPASPANSYSPRRAGTAPAVDSTRSKDRTLSQEQAREVRLSYAGECLEKARLPPGDLDLWTVAQLRMKPAIDARLDTFDELQINDLAPIRTEELGRIEALLDGHQTSG
jgi:hypothetical protein